MAPPSNPFELVPDRQCPTQCDPDHIIEHHANTIWNFIEISARMKPGTEGKYLRMSNNMWQYVAHIALMCHDDLYTMSDEEEADWESDDEEEESHTHFVNLYVRHHANA